MQTPKETLRRPTAVRKRKLQGTRTQQTAPQQMLIYQAAIPATVAPKGTPTRLQSRMQEVSMLQRSIQTAKQTQRMLQERQG